MPFFCGSIINLKRLFLIYEEALEIYRQLAASNPQSYLPDVALTAMNLSIFYLQAVPTRQKSIALAQECIDIAKGFHHVPIIQQDTATAQQVLDAWKQQ